MSIAEALNLAERVAHRTWSGVYNLQHADTYPGKVVAGPAHLFRVTLHGPGSGSWRWVEVRADGSAVDLSSR